jgi:putative restriction endonuclease
MTPVDRLRIEKAAADCGFELTLVLDAAARLVLRSAAFPELLAVSVVGDKAFVLIPSHRRLLGLKPGKVAIDAQGYGALYAILRKASATARTLPNRVADRFRSKVKGLPTSTGAERLVVQRVGQGLFRDALLDYWQGRCCVTGLAVPPLLRASHIKPWASCTDDDERLDVFNGLLLTPHVDALFDGGWISFEDSGAVIVSGALPAEAREPLGVSTQWTVSGLRAEHLGYLTHHRSEVLR